MTTTRILLAYHSSEGQTAKIADRIASALRHDDVTIEVVAVEDAPSPDGFDGVIAGDSIHAAHHSRALARYLSRYADELEKVPLALFQVSLTSATDDERHTTEAHRLMQRLLDATGADPDLVGLFAGALRYTHYGWLKRRIMRRIAAKEGGDTDTAEDHEYTDWEAVDHFAADALALFRDARARTAG